MDYQALAFWLSLGQFTLWVFTVVFVWIANGRRANQQDVKAVTDRVIRLEEHAGHQPSHDDIGKVYDRLNEINGRVEHNEGVLQAIQHEVHRIGDFLMKKGSM